MALTYKGFAETGKKMDEEDWATYAYRAGLLANAHGAVSGLVASAGAGTRTVSVTAGAGIVPGVSWDSSGTETVSSFAANGGSANRIDMLVLRATWGSTRTVALAVVQGSSATTPPTLTQTPGTLWEMPVARVTIPPTATRTTLLSTDVEACVPTPRKTLAYTATLSASSLLGGNYGTLTTIGTQAVPDPGWPYRIESAATFDALVNTGFVAGYVYVDTTTQVAHGTAAPRVASGTRPSTCALVGASPSRTGATTVTFKAQVGDGTGGVNAALYNAQLTFLVVPA